MRKDAQRTTAEAPPTTALEALERIDRLLAEAHGSYVEAADEPAAWRQLLGAGRRGPSAGAGGAGAAEAQTGGGTVKPPTEKQFMAQVIQLAKLRGWLVAHFRPGLTRGGKWVTPVQGDGKGFPDLVLVRPRTGELLVAELKTDRGKLTPEQDGWLCGFRACGIAASCWRPQDWGLIEKALE